MIKKWFEIITDHRISLYERMFRLVTGVCMIALIFTLPMGRSMLNIVLLAVSLVAMALIVRFSIRKKRIQLGATAIALLLLVLFPITFFPQAGFSAAFRNGLSSVLFMSASPCKADAWVFFSGFARRRPCFVMALPIIIQNLRCPIFTIIPFSILPFPW